MSKFFVDFLGTFFIILAVGCVISVGSPQIPAAFTVAATVMLFSFIETPISAGHFNPAITFCEWFLHNISAKEFIKYLFSQMLGVGFAIGVINLFSGGDISIVPLGFYLPTYILAEFIFSFVLCFVTLRLKRNGLISNPYYGLVIGSVYFVGLATVSGTICLGTFNPIVTLGVALMGCSCRKLALITIITHFLSALLVSVLFRKSYLKKEVENN